MTGWMGRGEEEKGFGGGMERGGEIDDSHSLDHAVFNMYAVQLCVAAQKSHFMTFVQHFRSFHYCERRGET